MKYVIIESIKDTTLTGKYLYERLNHIDRFNFYYFRVDDLYSLKTKIDKLLLIVEPDEFVLIDLESHGNELGLYLRNGFVPWKDLKDIFSPLNNKLRNSLTLMLAACKSSEAVKFVKNYSFCRYLIFADGILKSGAIVRFSESFAPKLFKGESVPNAFKKAKAENDIGVLTLEPDDIRYN